MSTRSLYLTNEELKSLLSQVKTYVVEPQNSSDEEEPGSALLDQLEADLQVPQKSSNKKEPEPTTTTPIPEDELQAFF